jgi:hypothetical protein
MMSSTAWALWSCHLATSHACAALRWVVKPLSTVAVHHEWVAGRRYTVAAHYE